MSRLLLVAVVLAVAGLVAAEPHDRVFGVVAVPLSLVLLGAWLAFIGRAVREALWPIDDEAES